VQEKLFIESANQKGIATIYNLFGDTIETHIIDNIGLNIINTENYPKGCYLLKFQNENYLRVKRFTKM